MSATRFIDTNVLVRYIAMDHAEHSPRAAELYEQMARGEIEGLLSMTVVLETVFVLERLLQTDRKRIARSIHIITGAPGVHLVDNRGDLLAATLGLYTSISQLSFADCYHAILSLEYCNGEIYTFDKDFGRIPGVARFEPGA